jgi:hypothetical protein
LDHGAGLRREAPAAPERHAQIPELAERKLLMVVQPGGAPGLVAEFVELDAWPQHRDVVLVVVVVVKAAGNYPAHGLLRSTSYIGHKIESKNEKYSKYADLNLLY